MPLGKGYMCIGMPEYVNGCTVIDGCTSADCVSLDADSSGSGDGLFGILGDRGSRTVCWESKLMLLSGAASCPTERERRYLDNEGLEASLTRG